MSFFFKPSRIHTEDYENGDRKLGLWAKKYHTIKKCVFSLLFVSYYLFWRIAIVILFIKGSITLLLHKALGFLNKRSRFVCQHCFFFMSGIWSVSTSCSRRQIMTGDTGRGRGQVISCAHCRNASSPLIRFEQRWNYRTWPLESSKAREVCMDYPNPCGAWKCLVPPRRTLDDAHYCASA